jgi:flavin-binding protein dodecin
MSNHVYRTLELVGSSAVGPDDAVRTAMARASATIRNLRWFQVTETRGDSLTHSRFTIHDS